jgi:hypothetical protein
MMTNEEVSEYLRQKREKEREPILAFLRSIATGGVTRRVSWNEIGANTGYPRHSQLLFYFLWRMQQDGIIDWRDKQEPENWKEDATWIVEIFEKETL